MKTKQQPASLNILLADDDTDDRFFFDKALKEIPIITHLTVVNDGEQLMNYLNKNSAHLPDILFLDLSMPRKTGFECLTEIKEDKKLKDIPVIVFTTSFGRGITFEESLINTLSKIGAQEYVRKPGDFEQLKQIIHKSLIVEIEKKLLKEQGQKL
jgi:CheY-like chemotaxis protein